MFRILLVLLLVVLAGCYWPVTSGAFVIDDYVFLAQSRMVDAPWAAFWSNHFYEPFYFRPIGVVLWWIATRVFELNYAAHSAINLALHAINIALLAALVRYITDRTSAAIAAASVFALLPFSFAAALWPSNRFDLLAVGFLLFAALACARFLRNGHPLTWLSAGVATLAACLSKELAFPIATAMACLCLIVAPTTPWQRRVGLFALVGGAITIAFAWRHAMLPMPYAAASQDVIGALARGAAAWWTAIPKVFSDASGVGVITVVSTYVLLAAILFSLITALFFSKRASGRARPVSLLVVASALAVVVVSAISQWPLASNFAPMLDGGALGTVTYARFYYAPAATVAIVLGLVIARARLARSLATLIVLCSIVIGLQTRSTAENFANWTERTIEPMSQAAARTVDAVSRNGNPICIVVFLGTQSEKNPWFRMFSDVTVKAITQQPESTWRCQVLTESTPWIFISPASTPLADIGLPTISIDARGTPKPDYVWGGVRYRYRTMVYDVAKLPNARFFDWNGNTFVDVTDSVRSGARSVKTHGWGF